MEEITLWFNPRCSKARSARDLLAEQGAEVELRDYLKQPPTREELEEVLRLLGTDDPRAILRQGETAYKELGLDGADRDMLLDAMVAHPILVERPIAIQGGKAVVGRPPERVLDLLGGEG